MRGNPIHLPHIPALRNGLLPRWQTVGGLLVMRNIFFSCQATTQNLDTESPGLQILDSWAQN